MMTSKTKQPWLQVVIISPTVKDLEKYPKQQIDLNEDKPLIFKKAKIVCSFDEDLYPINSEWMMGQTPGMNINFFGEKLILIRESDLYKKL